MVVAGRVARADGRRRDHDGRGRGHRDDHRAGRPAANAARRPRRSSPRASRRPSRSSPSSARAQADLAAARRQAGQGVPDLPRLRRRRLRRRRGRARATWRDGAARSPTSRSARARSTRSRPGAQGRARPAQFEGREKELSAAYRSVQKKLIRQRILRDKVRIDGRGLADIRPLSAEVEVIPRVHGSALFERGETQILGVTTLNMLRHGAAARHALPGDAASATCTTTTSRRTAPARPAASGSPKRREIGHGALAERALMPVLPSREEFPYAIRQVSEALGSNGSTSMGSVCASTLSLLNAGVPLQGAGRRHRDGPGVGHGRRQDRVRRDDRHPRRRGRVRRHGLQGRRHQGVRHRDPAGHQARRHPGLGAGRGADPGPRRAAAHPGRHGRGHRRAGRDVARTRRGSSR